MTKQIGVFKPKRMISGRLVEKKQSITISASLHEILSCEKIRKETFDDCISRIIKERATLRIEINRIQLTTLWPFE
ncbi:MAG TPA: hypothetical protein VF884_03090 [Nitrososphaeraceae archaeon]